jgi:hypothetical protein
VPNFIQHIRSSARANFLGVLAQILSAAPVVFVSILIGRNDGMVILAKFTTANAVSAVIYTVCLFGFRTSILKDRFRKFNLPTIVILRLLFAFLFIIIFILLTLLLSIPIELLGFLTLLRLGDMGFDLKLAIDQVTKQEKYHLVGYLKGQSIKLISIIGAAVWLYCDPSSGKTLPTLLVAGFIFLFFSILTLSKNITSETTSGSRINFKKFIELLHFSVPFLGAQLSCAMLTSYPRFVLDFIPNANIAGVVAASLTVSTLIGMLYYAVWLRWSPIFGRCGLKTSSLLLYLMEIVGVSMIGILFSILFGGDVVILLYKILDKSYAPLICRILICSFIFFSIMNISNLFKFSIAPWSETLVYLGGVVFFGLYTWFRTDIDIMELLIGASICMLFIQLLSVLVIKLIMQRFLP